MDTANLTRINTNWIMRAVLSSAIFSFVAFTSWTVWAKPLQTDPDDFECFDFAERVAARYCQISVIELRERTEPVYLCLPKKMPFAEQYYFGNGSTFVAVWVSVADGGCSVEDIFVGQDDQDFDYGQCQ